MSGKLIPEFDRRRNIRDMFSRKPSLLTSQNSSELPANDDTKDDLTQPVAASSESVVEKSRTDAFAVQAPALPPAASPSKSRPLAKRSHKEASLPDAKRPKPATQSKNSADVSKGQKSLKGFFAPKATLQPPRQSDGFDGTGDSDVALSAENEVIPDVEAASHASSAQTATASPAKSQQSSSDSFTDPFVAKESWGKLFVKRAAPKCEHDEPCKTMLTKKPGLNCGRSFWMCVRPLGPSGNKEKGTQWRCSTFIWASDWNGLADG